MMVVNKTIKVYSPDCTNSETVKEGIFLSKVNGDIYSYEIRITPPNSGKYLPYDAMHTFLHLFASFIRENPIKDEIIHFSPLPCRTGFCLLVRDLTADEVLILMKDFMKFAIAFTGKIPCRNARDCSNYIEHSIDGAKAIALVGNEILKDYTTEMMLYSE